MIHRTPVQFMYDLETSQQLAYEACFRMFVLAKHFQNKYGVGVVKDPNDFIGTMTLSGALRTAYQHVTTHTPTQLRKTRAQGEFPTHSTSTGKARNASDPLLFMNPFQGANPAAITYLRQLLLDRLATEPGMTPASAKRKRAELERNPELLRLKLDEVSSSVKQALIKRAIDSPIWDAAKELFEKLKAEAEPPPPARAPPSQMVAVNGRRRSDVAVPQRSTTDPSSGGCTCGGLISSVLVPNSSPRRLASSGERVSSTISRATTVWNGGIKR